MKKKIPELLAPAGGMNQLVAAVENGQMRSTLEDRCSTRGSKLTILQKKNWNRRLITRICGT